MPQSPTSNDVEEDEAEEINASYISTGFGPIEGLIQAAKDAWNAAWNAGYRIVLDETMMWWTGLTSGHLSFLPRKPTPLGF